VLCFIGGLAGLLVGMEGVRLLLKMRPDTLARIGPVQVNWTVLGFVTGISLLSGMLFGLAPALETRKVNLIETLKEAARTREHSRVARHRRGCAWLCVIGRRGVDDANDGSASQGRSWIQARRCSHI